MQADIKSISASEKEHLKKEKERRRSKELL
jgi:hypothetical protein